MPVDVLKSWRDLLLAGGAQHRLFEGHILHLYYGVDAVLRPIFFVVCDARPNPPLVNGLLTTDVRRREDGRWVAVLTLQNDDYAEAFMGLCLELARRTEACDSEQEGVALFDSTLHQWRKMLSSMSIRRLTSSEQRGLFAELVFGRHLAARTSMAEMVLSWGGPFGAAQDFAHPRLGFYEVKAVGIDAKAVSISSVSQLDPTPEAKVDLVIVRLDEDSLRLHDESRSLFDVISAIREELVADSPLREEFDERLAATGFDSSDPAYSEISWRVVSIDFFRTKPDFPRLLRSGVPAGVEDVRYRIALSALQAFTIPASEGIELGGGDDGGRGIPR